MGKTFTRRGHTNSRLGCQQCKKRHIKCDEVKPRCSNCVSHAVDCAYILVPRKKAARSQVTSSPTSSTISSEGFSPDRRLSHVDNSGKIVRPSSSLTRRRGPSWSLARQNSYPGHLPKPELSFQISDLQLADMELLFNFSTFTCDTLRSTDKLRAIWRDDAPRRALGYPFLMRALLSVSALHLSQMRPNMASKYLRIASAQHLLALKGFREQQMINDTDSGEAGFLFATIVLMYAFGFSHANSEHQGNMLQGDMNAQDFIKLTRGIVHITLQSSMWLQGSPVCALAVPFEIDSVREVSGEELEIKSRLSDLHRVIGLGLFEDPPYPLYDPQTPSSPKPVRSVPSLPSTDSDACILAITELQACFDTLFSLPENECKFSTCFRWPIFISDRYVGLLAAGDPVAMIIFAHYCVILKNIDAWWMQDWPLRMVKRIEADLPQSWHAWLDWPKQKLGAGWENIVQFTPVLGSGESRSSVTNSPEENYSSMFELELAPTSSSSISMGYQEMQLSPMSQFFEAGLFV